MPVMDLDEILEHRTENIQGGLENESIQVLISELAGKSAEAIAAIFDKVIYEGGKEAVDALIFIGDYSQA